MPRWMRAFLFGGSPPGATASELLLLVGRLVAGLGLAFGHGISKVPPPARFVAAVQALGFPAPHLFAWLSVAAELAGGVLLAAGLLTRPAAATIAFNMSVAAFLQQRGQPYSAREAALLYLALALVFLARGGGRFALDRAVGGRA